MGSVGALGFLLFFSMLLFVFAVASELLSAGTINSFQVCLLFGFFVCLFVCLFYFLGICLACVL